MAKGRKHDTKMQMTTLNVGNMEFHTDFALMYVYLKFWGFIWDPFSGQKLWAFHRDG